MTLSENHPSCYWRVQGADRFYWEFATLNIPSEGIPRLTAPIDQPWGMREFTLVDLPQLDAAGGLKGLEAHYERFSKRFGSCVPPPQDRLLQVGRIYVAAERHQEVLQLANGYISHYPAMAENLINQVGYDQLRRGQPAKAVQAFKRNVELFPDSPNVHDSLGDGYCRAGDSVSARRSYAQAARVAKSRSPQYPRLSFYKAKAKKGCEP